MIHDIEKHMFILSFPEGTAHIEYTLEGNVFTVIHTIVPKALEGQGIAAKLAEAAAAYAEKEHYTLASECSYMTAWMKRHGK